MFCRLLPALSFAAALWHGTQWRTVHADEDVADRIRAQSKGPQRVEHVPPEAYFVANAASAALPAVVQIAHTIQGPWGAAIGMRGGSGFIIDPSGVVLTNMHVIDPSQSPTHLPVVTLSDGRSFRADIQCYDRNSDVAVLRLRDITAPLPYLELGSSETLRTGEWVVALGSPEGLTNSATAGIVSNVSRHAFEIDLPASMGTYIQTDALINQGNSGGPLVNMHGQVIGINVIKILPAQFGLAIPIDRVKIVLEQLREHGRVMQPYIGAHLLGLTSTDVIDEVRARMGPVIAPDVRDGVFVYSVAPQGPAAKAGLQSGDVIHTVDGKRVYSVREVLESVRRIGQTIHVGVRRGADTVQMDIVTEAIPEPRLRGMRR